MTLKEAPLDPEYREALIACSRRYLSEIRDLAEKHRAADAYIRSLYEDAEGVGGVNYISALLSGSPNPDKLPNSVALLIEMKREAESDAVEYFERKREARRLLDEMDGTYGRLLMLYYVTALPWSRVAEVLNYSEGWCKHMSADALLGFYDHLPNEYKLGGTHAILDADF